MSLNRRQALKAFGTTLLAVPLVSKLSGVCNSAWAKAKKEMHEGWTIIREGVGKGKSSRYTEDIDKKTPPKAARWKKGRNCLNCSKYGKKKKEVQLLLADGKTKGAFSDCSVLKKHWVHSNGHCVFWAKKRVKKS